MIFNFQVHPEDDIRIRKTSPQFSLDDWNNYERVLGIQINKTFFSSEIKYAYRVLIRHEENDTVESWHDIAFNLGFVQEGIQPESNIKSAQRFVKALNLPIVIMRGKRVYSNKDILCSTRNVYAFGRNEIAEFLNISYPSVLRWYNKYPKLKNLIIRPAGKLEYANKLELKFWLFKKQYYKIKNTRKQSLKKIVNLDSVYLSAEHINSLMSGISNCPICNAPTKHYSFSNKRIYPGPR
jgi:hypothetical protein